MTRGIRERAYQCARLGRLGNKVITCQPPRKPRKIYSVGSESLLPRSTTAKPAAAPFRRDSFHLSWKSLVLIPPSTVPSFLPTTSRFFIPTHEAAGRLAPTMHVFASRIKVGKADFRNSVLTPKSPAVACAFIIACLSQRSRSALKANTTAPFVAWVRRTGRPSCSSHRCTVRTEVPV